jgi:large subunit ribosomal protein L4
MKARIFLQTGKETGELELPEEIFNTNINDTVLHLVVKSYLANMRQGTAKTKTRSEVSGGGKKPHRQKGTGRARAGSNTSPLWVRGGKAFGAIPKNFRNTIPKKMRKAALFSAYSSRAKEEKVYIFNELKIEKPKTKIIYSLLKDLSILDKKNLFIIGGEERNLYLSGRNIKNVRIKNVKDINALDILWSDNILFSSEGLIKRIQGEKAA